MNIYESDNALKGVPDYWPEERKKCGGEFGGHVFIKDGDRVCECGKLHREPCQFIDKYEFDEVKIRTIRLITMTALAFKQYENKHVNRGMNDLLKKIRELWMESPATLSSPSDLNIKIKNDYIEEIFYHICSWYEDDGDYQPTREEAKKAVQRIIDHLIQSHDQQKEK